MAQAPDTTLQIDGEPVELDNVADDTVDLDADAQDASRNALRDDEHPFSDEDYASAVPELAAEAEDRQAQVSHDETPDDAPVEGDDEVQALRRENARRRVHNQETDAENERLTAILTQYHRDTVERAAASTLVDPKDLWRVAELADVLTDDGTAVDERKVHAVIAERVPAHWAKPTRGLDFGGFSSGASKHAAPRPTSWASAISQRSE